jgi:hypothetical protein
MLQVIDNPVQPTNSASSARPIQAPRGIRPANDPPSRALALASRARIAIATSNHVSPGCRAAPAAKAA